MSLKQEKYMRLGRLTDLQNQLKASATKIDRLLTEIRSAAFPLEGPEAVDSAAIAQASEELSAEQARFLELKRSIAELEG